VRSGTKGVGELLLGVVSIEKRSVFGVEGEEYVRSRGCGRSDGDAEEEQRERTEPSTINHQPSES
jgi:hypothetical protein